MKIVHVTIAKIIIYHSAMHVAPPVYITLNSRSERNLLPHLRGALGARLGAGTNPPEAPGGRGKISKIEAARNAACAALSYTEGVVA